MRREILVKIPNAKFQEGLGVFYMIGQKEKDW